MVILLVVSEMRLLIRFKNIFIHKDRRRRSSHLLKEVGFRVEFLYENLKKRMEKVRFGTRNIRSLILGD